MLRIKLVKTGKTNRPMWRFVVVEKSKTGKGLVTDFIGNYNPHNKPKVCNIDMEKYAKWIASGAQPTDTVLRLKGKFVDKNKEYQKEVKPKVYKSKKAVEEKKVAPKAEVKEETSNAVVEEKEGFIEGPAEEKGEKKAEEQKEKVEKEIEEKIEEEAK